MFIQKVISRKLYFKNFFFWRLESQWRKKQDPDPLVRGMDLRIRIYTKISWIRNTARYTSICTLWLRRYLYTGIGGGGGGGVGKVSPRRKISHREMSPTYSFCKWFLSVPVPRVFKAKHGFVSGFISGDPIFVRSKNKFWKRYFEVFFHNVLTVPYIINKRTWIRSEYGLDLVLDPKTLMDLKLATVR